mgnify:CR=1 FL=1
MKCKNCGKNHDLTICFVYHSPEAKALLDANRRFIEEMDPAMNIQWLIADNTPEGRKATQHRQEGSVIIVPGAEMPMDKPAYARRSYHHARGLNKLLPYIQTRYALVLDIDFFILPREGITASIEHMCRNNLAFFGAPYHPKHYRKVRYFPCQHCLFVDTDKIALDTLDFDPQVPEIRSKPALKSRIARKIKKQIIGPRYRVGQTFDTGYPIYQRYYRDSHYKWDYVNPVWDARPSFFEHFLPERLSFYPKRKTYVYPLSFATLGYPGDDSLNGEAYVWNGLPFGYHVRDSTHKMLRNFDAKMKTINSFLQKFIKNPVLLTASQIKE